MAAQYWRRTMSKTPKNTGTKQTAQESSQRMKELGEKLVEVFNREWEPRVEQDKRIQSLIIRLHRKRTGCSKAKPCKECLAARTRPFRVPERRGAVKPS